MSKAEEYVKETLSNSVVAIYKDDIEETLEKDFGVKSASTRNRIIYSIPKIKIMWWNHGFNHDNDLVGMYLHELFFSEYLSYEERRTIHKKFNKVTGIRANKVFLCYNKEQTLNRTREELSPHIKELSELGESPRESLTAKIKKTKKQISELRASRKQIKEIGSEYVRNCLLSCIKTNIGKKGEDLERYEHIISNEENRINRIATKLQCVVDDLKKYQESKST